MKSGISAAAAKLFRILPEISAEQTYQIIESIWRAESMQKLCDILLPILDKAEQKFAETPVKAKKLSDLSKQYIRNTTVRIFPCRQYQSLFLSRRST